jgi:hypothetical protein
MIPYPVLVGDYSANLGYWWDLEFWNRSVTREAWRPDQFSGTPPGSFPKLELRFDPVSGKANLDLDMLIAQALQETRFHIAGQSVKSERGVTLVRPDRPWRADWTSTGLYNDGWTRPGEQASFIVYARPGQASSVLRYFTFYLVAPSDVQSRAATFKSNSGMWPLEVAPNTTKQDVAVCVPPHGHAAVSLDVRGASPIPGDQSTITSFGEPRDGGVLISQVALLGESESC